jgi:hypothetical protein
MEVSLLFKGESEAIVDPSVWINEPNLVSPKHSQMRNQGIEAILIDAKVDKVIIIDL